MSKIKSIENHHEVQVGARELFYFDTAKRHGFAFKSIMRSLRFKLGIPLNQNEASKNIEVKNNTKVIVLDCGGGDCNFIILDSIQLCIHKYLLM